MKIGFDVSQTGKGKAGCGFWAENLISTLASIDQENEYILYPTFGDHYWDDHYTKTYRGPSPRFTQGLTHSSSLKAKRFWQSLPADIEKKLGQVDLVHANNFFCPPKLPTTKIVYTLHDLSFIETPHCTTEHNRVACFNGVFQASLQADLIIAISQYTRRHFLDVFPHYPAERIVTIYPGCRFANTASPTTAPSFKLSPLKDQSFWLMVGTIEPRKNIKRLLNTYARLRRTTPYTYPLVLAGKIGWIEEDIHDIINRLDLTGQVYLLGYVSDQELEWLYKNCFCLTYPSLFEGFGLPILEAMRYGAPVITSNVSSMPEVIGNAGIIINPYNDDELYQAMINILTNHPFREDLKHLAVKQAQHFSWETSARKTLEWYKNILLLPPIDIQTSSHSRH